MIKSRFARYFVFLLVWLLLATVATTFIYESWRMSGEKAVWTNIARRQFVTYIIWGMILVPAIFWLSKRFPVESSNWRRTIPIHVAGAFAAATTHAVLRAALDPFTYPGEVRPGFEKMIGLYFLANGFNDLWMYWLFAFFALTLVYHRRFLEREVSAATLHAQLARTELQMLKMQLQPHFLFNTLHSISALMQRDIRSADRMLVQLSDLLRITLEFTGTEFVTLERELEFARGYVEIEKTRFQDRLTVVSEIDPEALDARVPAMLLQPLIENAVRHGIARRAGPGEIHVRAIRWNDRLRVAVINDVPAHDEDDSHGTGIGLTNTVARLKHLYPGQHTINAHRNVSGRFEVQIEFPITDDQVTAFAVVDPDRKRLTDMQEVWR